jgi:hypothetical protein
MAVDVTITAELLEYFEDLFRTSYDEKTDVGQNMNTDNLTQWINLDYAGMNLTEETTRIHQRWAGTMSIEVGQRGTSVNDWRAFVDEVMTTLRRKQFTTTNYNVWITSLTPVTFPDIRSMTHLADISAELLIRSIET